MDLPGHATPLTDLAPHPYLRERSDDGDDPLPCPRRLAWLHALRVAQLWHAALPCERRVLGGIRLRAGAGPVREAWLAALCDGEPNVVQAPRHADQDAFSGGLDMDATLRTGRSVRREGLLARAKGGTLVVHGTQDAAIVTALCDALDRGDTAIVLIDDGTDDVPPLALTSRLSLDVDLDGIGWLDVTDEPFADEGVIFAEVSKPDGALGNPTARDAEVSVGDDILCLLNTVSEAASPNTALRRLVQLHALTRLLAAEDTASEATPVHALDAVRICLGIAVTPRDDREKEPREPDEGDSDEADRVSQPTDSNLSEPSDMEGASARDGKDGPAVAEEPHDRDSTSERATNEQTTSEQAIEQTQTPSEADMVPDVVATLLPPGLLNAARERATAERLAMARASQGRTGGQRSSARGAPAGTMSRPPERDAPLSLLATLQAAVPWQGARARSPNGPIRVRLSDFRYRKRRAPLGTTVLFAVDASGSAASERLGEAKGAVEHLLADAYVRRDMVGLLAFRGARAEELLPPSRGLVRAKRSLGALPGGGGTPLAAGLSLLNTLALREMRSGRRIMLVLLTDGRGNVALDGRTGRSTAQNDEERTALALRRLGVPILVVDTASRPGRHARALAERLSGRHIVLPRRGTRGEHGEALGGVIEAELTARAGRSDRMPGSRAA